MKNQRTRTYTSSVLAWFWIWWGPWWCTEANEATQTHCYNPVAPAYLIWAYYAHGLTQMPRGSCWPLLRQTGEENWVVPASHGSAPFNRIWNITILRSPKQQIWLRTALCGGWCRRMGGMALHNRELHARNDDDLVNHWSRLTHASHCMTTSRPAAATQTKAGVSPAMPPRNFYARCPSCRNPIYSSLDKVLLEMKLKTSAVWEI